MKIVTAGHRGSVATGDEIRKKRHNKHRLFSYSLIILFSCTIGGKAANGAKMCQKIAPTWEDLKDARIAVGEGCRNQWYSNANDLSCSKVYMYFDGFRSGPCTQGQTSVESAPAATGPAGHWCRISGRKTWICVVGNDPTTGWGHYCGVLFSNELFNAGYFNTLMNAI